MIKNSAFYKRILEPFAGKISDITLILFWFNTIGWGFLSFRLDGHINYAIAVGLLTAALLMTAGYIIKPGGKSAEVKQKYRELIKEKGVSGLIYMCSSVVTLASLVLFWVLVVLSALLFYSVDNLTVSNISFPLILAVILTVGYVKQPAELRG